MEIQQTIPAGTVVKIGGFPFRLTEDAKAESATTLEDAVTKSSESALAVQTSW